MSLQHARTLWAGTLLFLGGASFWLINTISESLFPHYDIHDDALSRLGSLSSPTRWLWNSGVFFLAITWLLAVYLLFQRPGRRIWFALNLLPPLGVTMVGLFPASSPGAFHSIASALVFVTSGWVLVTDAVLIASPFRFFSLILGTIILGSLTLSGFTVFLPQALGQGGTERIIVYPIIIWLMSFGGFLIAWQSSPLKTQKDCTIASKEGPTSPQRMWQSRWIPVIAICLILCWMGLGRIGELGPAPTNPPFLQVRSDCETVTTHQAAQCTLTVTNPSRSTTTISWKLTSTSPVQFSSSAGSLAPGHSTTITLTLQESLCSFVVAFTEENPNTIQEVPLSTCSS